MASEVRYPGDTSLYHAYLGRNKGFTRVDNSVRTMRREGRLKFGGKIVRDRFADSIRSRGPFGQLSRATFLERGRQFVGDPRDIDQELFDFEPLVNTPITTNIKVSPVKKGVAGCRRRQIAIQLQENVFNTNVVEMDDDLLTQGNPLDVVNPGTWNEIALKYQKELWMRDPEAYANLTPADLFAKWKLIGVMEADDWEAGDPTERNRNCVVVEDGMINVGQYWRDMMPGSHCYMVIKKFEAESEKIMMPRMGGAARRAGAEDGSGAESMDEDGDSADDDDARYAGMPGEMVPMLPFQIGFYGSLLSRRVPDEVRQYRCEQGFMHCDSLVLHCGQVESVPVVGRASAPSYNWHDSGGARCVPFRAGTEQSHSDEYTFMQLIISVERLPFS